MLVRMLLVEHRLEQVAVIAELVLLTRSGGRPELPLRVARSLDYVIAPNLAEIDAAVRVVSTEPGGNSQ